MSKHTPQHALRTPRTRSRAGLLTTTGLAAIALSVMAPSANAAVLNNDGSVTIQPGDTLSQIATDYGSKDGRWGYWKGFTSGDDDLIYPNEVVGDSRRMDTSGLEAKSRAALKKGAVPTASVTTDDVDQLAHEVMLGAYGNGEARREALGDKYDAVQVRVNQLMGYGVVAAANATNSVNAPASNAASRPMTHPSQAYGPVPSAPAPAIPAPAPAAPAPAAPVASTPSTPAPAPSTPSQPSTRSQPSQPSMPSAPSTPSHPSTPSTPSQPSQPSIPSHPSTPSTPSHPSVTPHDIVHPAGSEGTYDHKPSPAWTEHIRVDENGNMVDDVSERPYWVAGTPATPGTPATTHVVHHDAVPGSSVNENGTPVWGDWGTAGYSQTVTGRIYTSKLDGFQVKDWSGTDPQGKDYAFVAGADMTMDFHNMSLPQAVWDAHPGLEAAHAADYHNAFTVTTVNVPQWIATPDNVGKRKIAYFTYSDGFHTPVANPNVYYNPATGIDTAGETWHDVEGYPTHVVNKPGTAAYDEVVTDAPAVPGTWKTR